MTDVTLIGGDSVGPHMYPSGYEGYIRYQAGLSGSVTSLKCYTVTALKGFRVALYADSSGSPGTLLGQGTGTSESSAWVSVSISSVSVVAGSYYWLAYQQETGDDVLRGNSNGGSNKYKSSSYTDFVSNPTGLGSGSWILLSIAAWGTTAAGSASVSLIGPGLCGNNPLLKPVL